MNTLLNKSKVTKGFLSLVLSLTIYAMPQTVFAQSSSVQPEDVSVGLFNPPQEYPSHKGSWPYALPTGNMSNSPVYEYNAYMYLPYLPWIGANIAQLVNYANFFYQLQQNYFVIGGAYNAPITTLANIARSDIAATLLASINTLTQDNVTYLFNTDHSSVLTHLIGLPGTDTYLPCSGISCTFGSGNTPPDNSYFNANLLFNSAGYSGDDAKKLNDVISFLSGLAQPFDVSNILSSDPEERRKQLQDTTVQKYLLMVRSYIASQSLVLSNFTFLAKEREVVSNLGKKAGMTTLPTDGKESAIDNASPLQVDEFLVKRRTGNPSWYTAVNNASSPALQRETLYVLAELNAQIFQLRMLNERMLASLSLIQMQSAQMNKSFMTYQQQSVSAASGSSSSDSSTSKSEIDQKGQEGIDKALNG